ncbi:MAG: hypothetical protein WB507_02365 [Solirubrobacterales bacterium]
MNWQNNKELAQRLAEISPLSYEVALQALEADGRPRELALSLLRSNEQHRPAREEIAQTRQKLHEFAGVR